MFEKYFLFLFLILSLIKCAPTQMTESAATITAQSITIESIHALNLSEDMSPVSTKEDEILLKVDIVKKLMNDFQREQAFLREFKFNEQNREHELSVPIDLSRLDADYLVFSLVELDERNSQEKLCIQLNELIEDAAFFQPNSLQIDSLISDDDFLGMKYIPLNKQFRVGKKYLEFSGRQLFDKYEYRLNYRIE